MSIFSVSLNVCPLYSYLFFSLLFCFLFLQKRRQIISLSHLLRINDENNNKAHTHRQRSWHFGICMYVVYAWYVIGICHCCCCQKNTQTNQRLIIISKHKSRWIFTFTQVLFLIIIVCKIGSFHVWKLVSK